MVKNNTSYNLFFAFAAFFVWGGWAYYVNSKEAITVGLISGITQGIASFFITLLIMHFVVVLFNLINKETWRVVLPAVLIMTVLAIILFAMHLVVGTPNIISTIWPSLTLAFLFCMFTANRLEQALKVEEKSSHRKRSVTDGNDSRLSSTP